MTDYLLGLATLPALALVTAVVVIAIDWGRCLRDPWAGRTSLGIQAYCAKCRRHGPVADQSELLMPDWIPAWISQREHNKTCRGAHD